MGWLTRAQAAALTEEERLDYLTRTVLGEAVGEGYIGMVVVAQVINNRTQDGRFPSDPVAVAGQKWQFTTHAGTRDGNQDMVRKNYGPGTREYRMAQAAVRAAIYEKSVPDITGNALHYHTIEMGYPATWPSSIKKHGFIDIGRHRVYPTHPVPPGEVPQKIAALQYVDTGVGTMLSVYDERAIKPIRPATMSGALALQRAVNNAAQQKANASATIRKNRALAFENTIDPFETRRPANTDPIINRPIPAMRESMRQELEARQAAQKPKATGTVNTTARTFALQAGGAGMDAPGVTLVSSVALAKPKAVASTPWGVRETVAANVAAAAASSGKGQIVMTGNPNIAGSVVDWLYPKIPEGQGEANQAGKGPRYRPDVATASVAAGQAASASMAAVAAAAAEKARRPGQSTIERNPSSSSSSSGVGQPPRTRTVQTIPVKKPGQTPFIERIAPRPPVVVVKNGTASVVPDSTSNDVMRSTFAAAAAADRPDLAMSLAAAVASKPKPRPGVIQTTGGIAGTVQLPRDVRPNIPSTQQKPGQTPHIERITPKTTLKNIPQSNIERITPKPKTTPTIPQPAGSIVPNKNEERLVTPTGLEYTPAPPKPQKLPPIAPPKSDPIGLMPKFSDLNGLMMPAAQTQKKTAPTPASVKDRELARGNPLFGNPTAPASAVPMPKPRPTTNAAVAAASAVPLPKPRPTTDIALAGPAPYPRPATERPRQPVPANRPALEITVSGSSTQRPASTPARPPAMTVVQQFQAQGMSAAQAYDAANQAAKEKAIQNASPGYNDPNSLWRQLYG